MWNSKYLNVFDDIETEKLQFVLTFSELFERSNKHATTKNYLNRYLYEKYVDMIWFSLTVCLHHYWIIFLQVERFSKIIKMNICKQLDEKEVNEN